MIIEKATQQKINCYYDLFVPDQAAQRPMPLLVALHGYEGNKESMMKLARKINSADFIIASVQAPNSFLTKDAGQTDRPRIGFGWMMQYRADETIRLHHSILRSVLEETSIEHPVDKEAVFLLAFSQSVSLNYRFAFTYENSIRGVIAVSGGIPGDWNEEKYRESATDVLIIAGEDDEIYPAERARGFKEAIARRAQSVEYRSYPVGHIFPRESLSAINEWMLKRVSRAG